MRVSCVSWRVTVKCSTVCAPDGASAGDNSAVFGAETAEVCALVPAFAVFVAGFASLVAPFGENESESGERGSVPAGEVPFAIAARGNPGAAKATHSANGARRRRDGGEQVVFFIRDFAFLAHRSCPIAGMSPMACLLFVWVRAFPLFFGDVYKKRGRPRFASAKLRPSSTGLNT